MGITENRLQELIFQWTSHGKLKKERPSKRISESHAEKKPTSKIWIGDSIIQ